MSDDDCFIVQSAIIYLTPRLAHSIPIQNKLLKPAEGKGMTYMIKGTTQRTGTTQTIDHLT
jgi:hypothetical protein